MEIRRLDTPMRGFRDEKLPLGYCRGFVASSYDGVLSYAVGISLHFFQTIVGCMLDGGTTH